ncbi:hypothetical protein [Bradyrhizobium sp. UNPA324]|uniref:hypothetical protein n=1 Tax=Bradyrhizobium sp. UNPA324 TaxID=1141174 RepID=UPI00114EF683|nr:hypothetical protein [Bradyrhizobium sp. UNPA324]
MARSEKPLKPLISFRPKPEVDEELKARAVKERRPLSHVVAIIVEDALAAERQSRTQRSAA